MYFNSNDVELSNSIDAHIFSNNSLKKNIFFSRNIICREISLIGQTGQHAYSSSIFLFKLYIIFKLYIMFKTGQEGTKTDIWFTLFLKPYCAWKEGRVMFSNL